MKNKRIIEALCRDHWLITRDALENIALIAQRMHDRTDFDALLAKSDGKLENTQSVQMRGSTAVVNLRGPIFRYANLFTDMSGATSIERVSADFAQAVDNPAVQSIVLNIDSPGGQVNGIGEFAGMVHTAEKPVVAYVGDMAASAAYWIAAAADSVVMAETALAGSIGAVMTAQVGEDDGSIEIVSSQSPKKRMSLHSEEGRAEAQSVVDKRAQVFIEHVADFRGVSVETVLSDFGQGGILVGSDAVAAGLADSLGSLESVIAGLQADRRGKLTGETVMSEQSTPEVTRERIAADYPEIAAAFRAEGVEQGAKTERERIQAIEALCMPGHEDLIAELKFESDISASEAAVKVLQAEQKSQAGKLESMKQDSNEPLPEAKTDETSSTANLPLEERCKAEWEKSPDLRAEFSNDYEAYEAFERAHEAGLARIKGDK